MVAVEWLLLYGSESLALSTEFVGRLLPASSYYRQNVMEELCQCAAERRGLVCLHSLVNK